MSALTQAQQEILANTALSVNEKCRRLLCSGLSQARVAELTGKTRNAVHGIAWRMRLQSGTANPAEFTFEFSRTFGIEIEFVTTDEQLRKIIRDLNAAGIACAEESYNHTTRCSWKVVSDGSVHESGMVGKELVSPVLRGEDGLRQLEIVCEVLDYHQVKVNNTCGLHVHLGASDLSVENFKTLALSMLNLERQMDAVMPQSRRRNQYCQQLSRLNITRERIQACGTLSQLATIAGTRYCTLNLEAYQRHGTVEFRQHSGSTNFTKIANWVRFTTRLVEYARQGREATRFEQFLDRPLVGYFERRKQKFAHA